MWSKPLAGVKKLGFGPPSDPDLLHYSCILAHMYVKMLLRERSVLRGREWRGAWLEGSVLPSPF